MLSFWLPMSCARGVREGVRPPMRPLGSMRIKIEAPISFASKGTSACRVKRTWVSTSSTSPFSQAIGALLSPTSTHASRLEELQTGALRAGEACAEWDRCLRI